MPRQKIEISLIPNRRKRAVTFTKRKAGVLKKARELATLCGVPVGVACGGPAGEEDRWESEGGVFERYLALPDEARAAHTHARYLQGLLGKERAKLARQRQQGQDGPAALAPPDAALGMMTMDELQEVLAGVDAALWAAGERRKALEMPEDVGRPGGVDDDQLLWLMADPGASTSSTVVPPLDQHGAPSNANAMASHGYQMYPPDSGADDINYGELDPRVWDAFMQGGDEGAHNQLSWSGFPYDVDSGFVPMDGYHVQAPCNGDAIGGYPSVHIGDNYINSAEHHHHHHLVLGINDGGGADNTLNAFRINNDLMNHPYGYGVGGDNFMGAGDHETTAQASSDDFQCSRLQHGPKLLPHRGAVLRHSVQRPS